MKSLSKLFFSLIIFLLAASMTQAQDGPEKSVRLGGSVQAMVSSAQTNTDSSQFGVGLRRIRLRAYASLGKKVKAFIQYSAKSNKVLDARITYKFSPEFQMRIGRFIGAGVKGGGLTSHTKIDIVERPVTAQKWGAATIGADYRDYGVAFLGNVSGFSYNLTFHNGAGNMNVLASHKSIGNKLKSGVAVSAMVGFKPEGVKGLDVGGYFGQGNKYYNDYSSYSGYVYYQPGKFRFKGEYVSWTNKNSPTELTSNGYYAFVAYKVMKKIELLARYETYDPNSDLSDDEQTDITIGAGYSIWPSKWTAAKVTLAYVIQGESGNTTIDDNVLYAFFQLIF